MIMLLHSIKIKRNIKLSLPHAAIQTSISEKLNGVSRNHAVFLCAKSQFFIMSSWVGNRKIGRFRLAGMLPIQPGSMHSIMFSGLKNLINGGYHA